MQLILRNNNVQVCFFGSVILHAGHEFQYADIRDDTATDIR
ncbi:hypothetical protein SFK227_5510 [Shigella flexneri K-227]|uniref:Uncharacterized protein n=1 Tax=Shigella flexneri K-227 TaxID=766147 RepID=F5P4S2_SHIFL|nr:hypothetical protein SFK227_5610 [Shigella flexneri K-227]EGK31098.1 hypothetical protein SFK227_5510 [Shigella flexneri K-227]